MSDSEEEDVILEKSPLLNYLENCEVDQQLFEPVEKSLPQVATERLGISTFCQSCINSQILEEQDRLFISDNLPSNQSLKISETITLLSPCFICAISTYFLTLLTEPATILDFAALATVIFLLAASFWRSFSVLKRAWTLVHLHRNVANLLKISIQLDEIFGKALGAIGERELLDWTYANKRTSLVQNLTRSASHLRRELFTNAKQLLSTFQTETRNIISSNKTLLLPEECDSFLSNLGTEALDPLFSASITTEIPKEWLSISALKAIWQFQTLQRSELLTVLCVLSARKSNFGLTVAYKTVGKCLGQTLGAVLALSSASKALQSNPQKENQKISRAFEPQNQAARRLMLHLELACQSASELQNDQESLSLLSEALKNALECVDELSNAKLPQSQTPNSIIYPISVSKTEKTAQKVLIPEDFEISLRDQVFEAKITERPQEPEATCSQNFEPETNPKNRVGRRMLTELKCALSGRAEEMRQRELQALAEFRGKTVDELLSEEQEDEEESCEELQDESEKPDPEFVRPPRQLAAANQLMNELQGQFAAFGALKCDEISSFGDSDSDG